MKIKLYKGFPTAPGYYVCQRPGGLFLPQVVEITMHNNQSYFHERLGVTSHVFALEHLEQDSLFSEMLEFKKEDS